MTRTRFINVDLDVVSTRPLRALANAMERAGSTTLHCGRIKTGQYRASFELGGDPRSADAAIRALARLVSALPDSARKLWESARLRDFAIGLDAGGHPFSFTCLVKPSTVAMVADLRARISFVVYAGREE